MEGRPLNMDLFDKLTFPRLNLKDNTLDDNDLARRCPLDNGHACNTPQQDLGALDALPLELLQVLLAQLDLRTLTDFRRVNKRALQVVDSIPGYKAITTHAPNALRGILSIGTGRWITCETLHDKLCTVECETCGDFGGYIYALTCKRVCFLCLSEHEAYLPVPFSLARRKFGINRQVLDTLPHFRSLPAQARASGRRNTIRRPRNDDPFDGQSGNPLRFMAIIQAPTFKRSSQEVEWGAYCVGCQRSSKQRPRHFRRRFTKESFSEHLHECGHIRDGVHQDD
ncbi:hypothetical protein BDY21DRAFT_176813 [Lineolata rhizophorae]|uniref:F-box domain-containing protein n=1 Tax=Lineolata rhizophorae TaxID=578093 RepID=A0A6A6P7I9_9PEZI|nr:hypothetical protein BDY21DRAFT_176813 [Lineolata rhizophorae]